MKLNLFSPINLSLVLVAKSCLTLATPWTVAHQAPQDSLGNNTGVGCHFVLQVLPNFMSIKLFCSLFPCGSAGKESTCNPRDLGWIPGLGRFSGEGIGYPFQYSWASLVAQMVKNLPVMREI